MKKILVAMILAVLMVPSVSMAESSDAEGVIKSVDIKEGTITLEDGKVYTATSPAEFDFSGLEPGVKVIIYYSGSDGKRVIDDLQTE
jgi:Cu/Ag efflux protein CusF